MKLDPKSTRLLFPLIAPVILAGCVWKSDYDKL